MHSPLILSQFFCINAAIFLLFKNVSNNLFESNGTAQYVITVAKSGKRSNITTPPATEVDIPFTVEISSKTASYGTGIHDRKVFMVIKRLFERLLCLRPILVLPSARTCNTSDDPWP